MSSRFALLAVTITLLGCPKEVPPPDPLPGQAPLETGLVLAGRSTDSLPLPRADEAGYSIPTASPVVDAILARPLAAAPFADRVGDSLDAVTTPSEALDALRVLAPGGNAPSEPPPEAEPDEYTAALPTPTDMLASQRGLVLTAHIPASFRGPLIELVTAVEEAHAAWEVLEPESLPARAAEEFFIDKFGGDLRLRSHPVGVQLEFARAAQGLHYDAMLRVAADLSRRVEELLPRLHEGAAELPPSSGPLLYIQTSLGALIVGSTGPDKHGTEAFLVVDPGGDDQWQGAAGSNVGVASRVGVAIDLAGRDTYNAGRAHAQGAGYAGVGMLIDAGDAADDYICTGHCQGVGFFGVGVLWDQGGDDARQAQGFAQGAGTFGVGLLLDGGGSDRTVVASRGQGFASTAGLGAYLDLGGDDQARLGVPGEDIRGSLGGGGQGAAWGTRPFPWPGDATLHGGVGLLYDRAGNDGYYARAYGQGSAEVLSFGLLLDRAGDDRYIAEFFGQASASHLAAAVLVDGGGADSYQGTNTVQAAAVDRSVAALWDRGGGSDSYRLEPAGNALVRDLGGGIAWARQAHALAALVDEGGDDLYVAQWDGIAFAVPPARPDRGATALLADLAGQDSYAVALTRPGGNAAEGATWIFEDRAVGMDSFASRAGWDHAPLQPEAGFPGFAYDASAALEVRVPEPAAGDPFGDPEARWLAAAAAFRALVTDPAAEVDVEWLRKVALSDPDRSVRRAAARALVASGDSEGVDVLVDSLVWQAEDNWDRVTWDTVRFQLHLLTGLDPYLGHEAWRVEWRAIRDDFDVSAHFVPVAAFERARSASARRDLDGVVAECSAAIEASPDARQPCSSLVGLWAWVLGHPESHVHHDPDRAVELGQVAVVWAPDEPEHFVNLARAFLARDEIELAERSLRKAEVLDPDDSGLLAVRRQLEAVRGD